MNLNITQKALHHLLPGKLSRMAEMYAEDNNVSLLDALLVLYQSETYKKLEIEETKYWHLGPVALYEFFLLEKTNIINK